MVNVLEREGTENLRQPFASPPVTHHGRNRKVLYALGAVLLGLALTAWRITARPGAPSYSTVTVERGTIRKTINATGRLQALTTVQVGTQISGTISDIYVDFNDHVRKGQVIARLDPSQLQAQLTQAVATRSSSQATVQAAQSAIGGADANVQAAEFNVQRLQAAVQDAQRNVNLARGLFDSKVGARKDLDAAETALAQAIAQKEQAVSQVSQARSQAQASRSQLAQAQAQSAQAGAAVQLASVNLDHATVRAPIDGVIVARNVDVGQTVASSFQSPTLFLIANDLTRMQVLADIDEADVGQLHKDSPVRFTVDAYPNETFQGQISQIRLAPQTVQNVVTYTAVIDVANPDMKLKPGMTATVTATVAEKADVLTVPNAALRFRPDSNGESKQPRNGGGPVLWRVADGKLEPVRVRLGLSDGASTEVLRGNLNQGDQVAVAAHTANQAPRPAATNPLMPSRPRGGGR